MARLRTTTLAVALMPIKRGNVNNKSMWKTVHIKGMGAHFAHPFPPFALPLSVITATPLLYDDGRFLSVVR